MSIKEEIGIVLKLSFSQALPLLAWNINPPGFSWSLKEGGYLQQFPFCGMGFGRDFSTLIFF